MYIVTLIVLIILLILVLLYVVRMQIAGLLGWVLRILVAVFTITTLTGLFLPVIFEKLADSSLRHVGVYESIKKLDEAYIFDNLANQSGNVINDITDLFNNQDSENTELLKEDEIFEKHVYKNLVHSIAVLYQILDIVFSLLGLIGIVYLSFATQGITELQDLRKRYALLEKRIEDLERLDHKD